MQSYVDSVMACELRPGDVCVTTFGAFTIVGVEDRVDGALCISWIEARPETPRRVHTASEVMCQDDCFAVSCHLIRGDDQKGDGEARELVLRP